MEEVWRFLNKLGIKPSCDPAILLLGMSAKTERDPNMYPNVHCSTIYNSWDMEAS